MKLQLTAEQYAMLLEEIPAFRVRQLRGQSHLEAWDVRRTLIRVFGFGGFDIETKRKDLVAQIEIPPGTLVRKNNGQEYANDKTLWTVVYTAEIRLTIKNPDGSVGAVFEDGASGDSANQPSLGDAHDQALKTALSQGLKRCAVNLGDQFGLSLYNNGRTNAVVLRTLVEPSGASSAVEIPRDEAPVQGEPEPQHDAAAAAPEQPAAKSSAEKLLEQIHAASDKDQLAAAWKAIAATASDQAINVEQREALATAWKQRKAKVLPKTSADDPQRRRMMALFTQAEIHDHDHRVTYARETIGRPIETTNDLTDDEVQQVIGRLERWIAQSTPQDREPAGAGAR